MYSIEFFAAKSFLSEFVDSDLMVEALIKEPVRLSPVDRVESSRGQDFNILKKNSSPLFNIKGQGRKISFLTPHYLG
jgi:hypothetical protein